MSINNSKIIDVWVHDKVDKKKYSTIDCINEIEEALGGENNICFGGGFFGCINVSIRENLLEKFQEMLKESPYFTYIGSNENCKVFCKEYYNEDVEFN